MFPGWPYVVGVDFVEGRKRKKDQISQGLTKNHVHRARLQRLELLTSLHLNQGVDENRHSNYEQNN